MHTAVCISFDTIIAVHVSFPLSDAPLHNLRRAAKRRQRAAYQPGTRANQRCQLSCYLTFCLTHGLDYVDPSEDTLCLYVEYLAQRFTNPKSVTNYLSAIQLFHNLSGVAASNIHGFQYRTMLRALPLTMRHTPLQRLPIDPRLLVAICPVCDNLSAIGIVLKLAFPWPSLALFARATSLPTPLAHLIPVAIPLAEMSQCRPPVWSSDWSGAKPCRWPALQ